MIWLDILLNITQDGTKFLPVCLLPLILVHHFVVKEEEK